MSEYIDKSALVAEIKKRFDEYTSSILKHYDAYKEAKAQELGKILTILDTLEVKEMDLEKEYDDFQDLTLARLVNRNAEILIAKHFYELGLKVQKEE